MEIMKFAVTACVYIGYITVILFPMPMDIEDAGFSAINFIPMKTIIGYLVEGVKDGMMENALIQILGKYTPVLSADAGYLLVYKNDHRKNLFEMDSVLCRYHRGITGSAQRYSWIFIQKH